MWNETYLLSELPSEEETIEQVKFIRDALSLNSDMTLLDLCCGQGRHSFLLAELGCFVIGLDSSLFLLNEASQRQRPKNLKFLAGDMRAIPLDNVCDAVINVYTSFGFFDDMGNAKVLSEVAKTLKTDGKFFLEYWNPHSAMQLSGVRNWWWLDEHILALAEVEYEVDSGVLNDYRTIIDLNQNNVEESVNRIRFYFPTELEERLNGVGLKVLEMYGDFDGSGYAIDSPRLIAIAEK